MTRRAMHSKGNEIATGLQRLKDWSRGSPQGSQLCVAVITGGLCAWCAGLVHVQARQLLDDGLYGCDAMVWGFWSGVFLYWAAGFIAGRLLRFFLNRSHLAFKVVLATPGIHSFLYNCVAGYGISTWGRVVGGWPSWSQLGVLAAVWIGPSLLLTIVGFGRHSLARCDHLAPHGQCRRCGYNLTGNLSGVCPECGNPI
jgi:hypothetical protein